MICPNCECEMERVSEYAGGKRYTFSVKNVKNRMNCKKMLYLSVGVVL